MTKLHLYLGIAVLASNGLAAAWGAIAWTRRDPSTIFWYLLRTAQVIVVVQVVLGAFLLGSGKKPPDSLHYVYGIAPLVVSLVCEAASVLSKKRLAASPSLVGLKKKSSVFPCESTAR